MDQLFDQQELTIQPIGYPMQLLVIGDYEGSTDKDVDKANANTVLALLFPKRWKESATVDVSANTATLTSGFDSRIVPLVYKNGTLIDESTYSFVASTGVFSAFNPTLTGIDVITVTLVKNIFGAKAPEISSDFPSTTTDITGLGTIDPIYTSIKYEDTKHTLTVKGTFDIRKLRRKYPTVDLEKAVFGADWTSGGTNELKRNPNPFFVAWIYWHPEATTGELEVKKIVSYHCSLQKPVIPMPKDDGAAEYEINAVALYRDSIDTIK